jgi:hypothetical protein
MGASEDTALAGFEQFQNQKEMGPAIQEHVEIQRVNHAVIRETAVESWPILQISVQE